MALVRVEARDRPAAHPGRYGPVDTPVTVISHLAGRFFSRSQGVILREGATVNSGRNIPVVTITADHAFGSKGAPVSDSRGAIAGIISSMNTDRDQVVFQDGRPAQAIRSMAESPPASMVTGVERRKRPADRRVWSVR